MKLIVAFKDFFASITIIKHRAVLSIGLGAVLCFFSSSLAHAGTIKKIDRKKKLVLIDEGKSGGVTKTSKVCFKDTAGLAVGCGKISKIKESTSTVKVSAKTLKKLKKGFEATIVIDENGEKTDSLSQEATTVESSAGTSTPQGKWRNNIKLAYILSPKTSASFNRLSYQAPTKDDSGGVQPTNSLWSKVGAVNQSLIGIGLEAEFAISSSLSFAFGLKQKQFSEFKVESDYDTKDGAHFAETIETASSQAFWFDLYYFEIPISPSFIFRVANGVDYDLSKTELKITHKYDGSSPEVPGNQEFEIAKASSKLSVISLRTVLNTHYFFDPFGLNFALNILIPVSASEGFSGSVSDPNASHVTGKTAADDLKEALGHKKSSVGLEAFLGAYYAF